MLDFDCHHEIKPSSSSGDGTQKISADAATVVDLRSHRGRISTIPVLEINKDNLNQLWTYLLVSIKNSSFISVDLELSGLGIEKGWLSQSINDRYKLIRKSAQSRAILSIGLTTFQLVKRKETETKKRIKYKCQVFNILTLCASAFTVEPDGLQFLASHSFDFNRLIKLGIPYASHDCGVSGKNGFSGGYGTYSQKDSLRILWNEILCSSIPIAFHNGLIDLAFIYEHFYSTLPETLDEFVMNLSDWFMLDGDEGRPGLYDSKYLAEFVARMNASYLEYVFRKCQRDNAIEASSSRAYISVDFDSDLLRTNFINGINNDQKSFEQINCELPEEFREPVIIPRSVNDKDAQMICKKYAAFGFCPSNRRCYLSHNIDLVLDLEEQKQSKIRERRKRRYDYASKLLRSDEGEPKGAESTSCSRKCSENEDDATNGHLNGSMENEIEMNNTEAQLRSFNDFKRAAIGCHRAGMDSFMTGFAVIFMSRMAILRTGELNPEHGNRLPLRGKPIPLLIHRSEFTVPTAEHCTQWERISIERERRKHLKNIQLNGIS